jgi:integrase
MYTGLRVSDVRLLGTQNIQGDKFKIKVVKGRNRNPVDLTIKIHHHLQEILKFHKPSFVFIHKSNGEPYSEKGFSNRVSKWFTQAGLEHCSGHPIRKGLATNLAESGVGNKALDGLFGWSGGKTSEIYTKKAEQAKLADSAVDQIDWGFDGVAHTPKKALE